MPGQAKDFEQPARLMDPLAKVRRGYRIELGAEVVQLTLGPIQGFDHFGMTE